MNHIIGGVSLNLRTVSDCNLAKLIRENDEATNRLREEKESLVGELIRRIGVPVNTPVQLF